MPRGTEWLWLLGVAATGLVLFNVALVEGSRHAAPAALGVGVACAPLLLALLGPLLEGYRPRPSVLVAALVVTCGASLVEGLGRNGTAGTAWAAVVFGSEAGFTLLAVPVLQRLGPWGVSVHATWLAAALFAAAGLVCEGPTAAGQFSTSDWLAIVYLAIAVTAVAFILWYTAVARLGAGRAGLLTGVAPGAAAAAGVVMGDPFPQPLVWVGIVVVAAGLCLGLGDARQARRQPPRSSASTSPPEEVA
jgi:drug/metabolite transporter (DMT)-like permease